MNTKARRGINLPFLFCFQLRTESGLDSTGLDRVLESCFSNFQLKHPHREKMGRSPWFEPGTPSLFIPYSPPSFGEDVLVRRTDVVRWVRHSEPRSSETLIRVPPGLY